MTVSIINRKFNIRYMNEAAEGGDPGAGSDDGEDSGDNTPDPSELLKQIEAKDAEVEAMRNKMDQLLGETKKAKQQRREAEEQARREAEEKARKAGDFEQLFKSSQQQREELENELNSLRSTIAQKEVGSVASKLAAELADGANAEILSEFISRRLKYTDDGIKVTDNNGDLTVSTLDNLKAEFENSSRYASLLRGSQASGGSATGGTSSAQSGKVITRSDFDSMNPVRKSEFMKSGGKVVD